MTQPETGGYKQMKILLLLLILTVLAYADNDGCTEIGPGSSLPGTDDIVLVLLNDWVLAEKALGLDIFNGVYILGVDNVNMYVQAYDATTCAPLGTLPLDPANASCFGIAWNNDATNDTYYTDDWTATNLFFTDDFGSTWSAEPNPAGNSARGMDFDGTDYWTTNGNGGGLWRFVPGVGQDNIAIPEVPTQPSGVTVFPMGSNVGVAVTAYQTLSIFFYEWDGATLSFTGSAPCPAASVYRSYGLAYAETNGNIFWSYQDNSSNYHIAEFSFDMVSLEQSSWGAIKSSF